MFFSKLNRIQIQKYKISGALTANTEATTRFHQPIDEIPNGMEY